MTRIARNREPTKIHNILGGGPEPPVQVRGATPSGIELHDGLILPSSCIFLDGNVFLWDVPISSWAGWNKEHFEVFEVVVPKPGKSKSDSENTGIHSLDIAEILILGTGKAASQPPPTIRSYLNSLGIQLDVMDTVRLSPFFKSLAETQFVLNPPSVERMHDVQFAR